MDQQTTFLLALGLLIAAGLVVSVSGWILFVRDRHVHGAGPAPTDAHHPEVAEER